MSRPTAHERALSLRREAQRFFGELQDQGFSFEEIVQLAVTLLGLATDAWRTPEPKPAK